VGKGYGKVYVNDDAKTVTIKKIETNFPTIDEFIDHHVLFLSDANQHGRLISRLISKNSATF